MEKKKSQNTQIDWAKIIFAGVAIAMIYEIFQDGKQDYPQGAYSPDQYEQDLEHKRNQEIMKNHEQDERYEQDRQTRENEQQSQQ